MSRPLWSKKLWFVSVLLLLPLNACKHQPAKPATPPPPAPALKEDLKPGELQVVVEDGESSQPEFAPTGDKLLFVSRQRPNHTQDQVYEKDLVTGAERRLTYQNGNTETPRYDATASWLLYSSSTDELKEDPPLLHGALPVSRLPLALQEPSELYLHALKGFSILRLTEHPGFDGEANFSRDGKSIVFTRVTDGRSHVFTVHREGKTLHEIKNLGVNPTQYVTSADGQTHAWIEWDESFGVARLRLQTGDKTIELNSAAIVEKMDLRFTPDGQALLWAQRDPSGPAAVDLWMVNLKDLCPHLLSHAAGEVRRHPVVSPDLKWLAMTWQKGGRSRIARQLFRPVNDACSP